MKKIDKLIATRNGLNFNHSDNQYIEVPFTKRYNFGVSDWSISFLVKENAGVASIHFQLRGSGASDMVSGTGGVRAISDQGTIYSYVSDFAFPKLTRVTLQRRSNNFEVYFNSRKVYSTPVTSSDTWNIFDNSTGVTNWPIGTRLNLVDSYFNGLLSNFVIVRAGSFSYDQLEYIHNTNIIPTSLHLYVIAHYPFNQCHGSKVFDVVEQYNYSKSVTYRNTDIQAGEFIIYSGDQTLTYGNDSDGNYLQILAGSLTVPNYTYDITQNTNSVPGETYKIKLRIRRVDGNGVLRLENYAPSLFKDIDLSLTPVGELKIIEFYFTATSNNFVNPVFLIGTSSAGMSGDTYRIYSLEITALLNSNHANLINFTSNENGVTNTLIQSAWVDLKGKKKKGYNFLKLNSNNGYASIPSYTNRTFSAGWSMYFDISTIDKNVAQGLFYSRLTTDDDLIRITLLGATPIRFDIGDGDVSTLPISGNRLKIFLINNGVDTTIIIVGIGSQLRLVNPQVFSEFNFNSLNNIPSYYFQGGFGKFLFLDRAITQRDINLITNSNLNAEYKSLSNIQLDIDFGDVFLNAGNYYARDNSGYARHAQLFNFTPGTDQPLRIEQSTNLPERIKALRFNGMSHHIRVFGFTPTSELGYTHIIGFCLNADRAFSNSYSDVLLSKRNTGGGLQRVIYGESNSKKIVYGLAGSLANYSTLTDLKTDLSKPQFVAYYDAAYSLKNPKRRVFINTAQVVVDNNGTPLGYDEIDGDLYIGSDDLVQQPGSYFNGYLSFVGIWKGDLTQPQIINIINNGLSGNANSNLMPDCQLYLNFEEIITTPPLLDLPGIASGAITNAGTPIITYGTDGDGDYVQFQYSGAAPTESIYFTNLPGYITQVEARYIIKYKVISPSIFIIVYTTYNSTAIYINGGNTIQTLVVTNAPSNPTVSFQYQSAYSVVGETIRIYSIKVELTNPYKIKDWSPQNRAVVLNNYTLAEITPGDPLHKLVDIDSLR